MTNTGINGADFVLLSIPIIAVALVLGVLVLNRFAPQVEAWGRRHIKSKDNHKV